MPLLALNFVEEISHIIAEYASDFIFVNDKNRLVLIQEKTRWLKPLQDYLDDSKMADNRSSQGNQIGLAEVKEIMQSLQSTQYLLKEFWKEELIFQLKKYQRHGYKLDNSVIYAACVKMVGKEELEKIYSSPCAGASSTYLPTLSTSGYSLSSSSSSLLVMTASSCSSSSSSSSQGASSTSASTATSFHS